MPLKSAPNASHGLYDASERTKAETKNPKIMAINVEVIGFLSTLTNVFILLTSRH